MAESTLSITYTELSREVARFLGWDRALANWTADQLTDFGDILKAGLRKFYYPSTGDPARPVYEWSFLRPVNTLSVSVAGSYDYDLPDDCSGIIVEGSVTYDVGVVQNRMQQITDGALRAAQAKASGSGAPKYFSVHPKAHAPTTGLRHEMYVYPTPDATYSLRYQYVVLPGTIDGTNIYPYGGAAHSETISEAILSEAESMLDDESDGVHQKRFQQLLLASMRLDDEYKKSKDVI